jgi:ElaB/YqjD/DUF883 family membrane-anchored ribosome-binding protein
MESTTNGNGKSESTRDQAFSARDTDSEGLFSDLAGSFKLSDETRKQLDDAAKASSEFVRKYPLATVIGVSAAAFVLGYLLRGGSRSRD